MTRSALASMHALVHKTKPGTARFRFWAPWLALLAAALAACSPTFNWREVRASDGAFVVALPDKPQRVTRSVTVDGRAIEMTMVSTGVGPTLFAVGVARLPADLIRDAAAREKTMTYFREGLMRNIGATTNNAAEVKIARAGAPGVTGEQVSARGRTGTDGRATQLVARLALVDDRLYQVVALGAEGELPPEVLDTFFTSFRILI